MPEKDFPQTTAGIAEAMAFIESALGTPPDDAPVSGALADRALLVAGEVLANAVEHGGTRPDVSIGVAVHVAPDLVEIVVHEPVSGVGIEAIRAGALPDDRLALEGRGLFLIRTLSDEVRSEAGGAMRYRFRPRPEP